MKRLLCLLITTAIFSQAYAQKKNFWTEHTAKDSIKTHKSVARNSFPKEYKLFDINEASFKNELLTIVDKKSVKRSTIITLPNADGNSEDFELTEASNFDSTLQARFPEIRSYSGKGINDKSATVKLSISPDGIQSMVFRVGRENEFIEPYSEDKKTYASFRSQRKAGAIPWNCSTVDKQLISSLNQQVIGSGLTARSGADLKTLRLAQSCNGEYAKYFGATDSTQVAKVLAAYNATLTRCNGVYEKDLALHLNLIDASTNVIYYNASTDPYTTMSSWNSQLQKTLTAVIGEANYDIGHMFGASGGGGNAGCIGCICTNGSKGSGITSPSDGIPQGDNFDIDYVVHEVGHQLGANHTFSMSNEGTGVNMEVGSGITIMSYAGITSQDVAPHSIDIFHQASINQIQTNLGNKACPVTTSIAGNNATPVVAPMSNYTIPKSTPFALTGSATDTNGDILTYCWEQNDNASSSQTGSSSVASATKATGPNWISNKPTVSPTRYFPQMATILAGKLITGPLTGGDAIANTEALSSVGRTLNFRLTVRDNVPYNSVSPITVGQTAYTDVAITVNANAGPFEVTSPNTAVTLGIGTTQTITWNVNNTNASPINCANVKISLSTDGGLTFPTVLAASTPNDGTEDVLLPSSETNTGRIKIEAVDNIFFDVNNTNFIIGQPPLCGDPTGLNTTAIGSNSAIVGWNAVNGATGYSVEYKLNASSTWTNFSTLQATTAATLNNLTQASLYNWRVIATCPAGNGNYVAAQFTTTTPTCQSAYDSTANGTTNGAARIPFNTDIKGLINERSDIDNYKFVITTGGTITITLTTLPANYNLKLLNSAGTQVGISQKSNKSNESISYTAVAGTYYAQVYGSSSSTFNATSCYTLKVALGTATKLTNSIPAVVNLQNGSNASNEVNITKIAIYPNPVKGILNVNMNAIKGMSDIKIYNTNGVLLRSHKTIQSNNQLNLAGLVNGVYIITITNESGEVSRFRIVKQ